MVSKRRREKRRLSGREKRRTYERASLDGSGTISGDEGRKGGEDEGRLVEEHDVGGLGVGGVGENEEVERV